MAAEASPTCLQVEVLAAWPDRCLRQQLALPLGSAVSAVRSAPGLLPELAAAWDVRSGLGSYGRLRGLDESLQPGDRIEILRGLTADPKEARRLRVTSRRQAKKASGQPDRWTRDR